MIDIYTVLHTLSCIETLRDVIGTKAVTFGWERVETRTGRIPRLGKLASWVHSCHVSKVSCRCLGTYRYSVLVGIWFREWVVSVLT
jgi:hypothetical protein